MKPADFLKKKTEGNFCGYLKSSFKNGCTTYECGNQIGLLDGMSFDEPCTTEIWNSCPMNKRYSAEEIIKKSRELPLEGQSIEAALPLEMQVHGQKWTIEKKDSKYNVYKVIIYPSTGGISKPPRTKIEKID